MYDGAEEVETFCVPAHRLSDKQAKRAMHALAARHLSLKEIVLSSLSTHKGGPEPATLLDLKSNLSSNYYAAGENPHYTARVVEIEEGLE